MKLPTAPAADWVAGPDQGPGRGPVPRPRAGDGRPGRGRRAGRPRPAGGAEGRVARGPPPAGGPAGTGRAPRRRRRGGRSGRARRWRASGRRRPASCWPPGPRGPPAATLTREAGESVERLAKRGGDLGLSGPAGSGIIRPPAARDGRCRSASTGDGPVHHVGRDCCASSGGIRPEPGPHGPRPRLGHPRDVIRIQKKDGRLYELVDGTLVAKAHGHAESFIAGRVVLPPASRSSAGTDLGLPCRASRACCGSCPTWSASRTCRSSTWDQCPDPPGAQRGRSRPRPRPGRRGPEPGEHPARDGPQAEGVLPRRCPARLAVDHRKRTVDVYTAPDDLVTA